MDDLHIGTQSVRFDAPPSILSFAAIGGKKEQEGPLASYFDFLSSDTTFGQKSWEKAESELQKRALDTALHMGLATHLVVDQDLALALLERPRGATPRGVRDRAPSG